MTYLNRNTRNLDITLSTATASATTLDMRDVAGAIVSFGTMSASETALQLWVSSASAGTYRRLYKADGTVCNLTLAASTNDGRAYSLPDEVFATQYVRIVSNSTHSSGVAGVVMLKS